MGGRYPVWIYSWSRFTSIFPYVLICQLRMHWKSRESQFRRKGGGTSTWGIFSSPTAKCVSRLFVPPDANRSSTWMHSRFSFSINVGNFWKRDGMQIIPDKCPLNFIDSQLLSNGSTALSQRCVWSVVWGRTRLLGSRCESGRTLLLDDLHAAQVRPFFDFKTILKDCVKYDRQPPIELAFK